ncbi:hypothetical protein FH103_01805 [Staphylococcus hominis]|uniref:hypothetical protein n=1 Tax=Staphylococcus hominis TaxID=1290 RepID=UPI001F586047|nr:hypothetical protein [Staphylococcus hominis]
MNTLKTLGKFLINNLVAILFLLGLALLNISIYLKFDYIIGLLATGVTLIVISLIYQFEKSQQPIK